MKRCIVFFFYDKDGIVDRYVFNMLDDLNTCSDRIVFVCNGKLAPESRTKLEAYNYDIITRENEGMDVWAYKEAIEYLGWDTIYTFDEFVMMNFTIYPTQHTFKNMFSEMENEEMDFWGATEYFSGMTAVAGLVPDHMNSHFIAVRKPMLNSFEFKYYWTNMPKIETYVDSVKNHESQFTKRFSEFGFTYKIYAAAEELRGITDCPVQWNLRYMAENTKLPFVKRKTFFYPPYDGMISKSTGEAASEAYSYLSQFEDYDTDAIWENILRTASLSDIKNGMQLNCILPSKINTNGTDTNRRICVVLYSADYQYAGYFKRYFDIIPSSADIHIFSPTEPTNEFSAVLSDRKLNYHPVEPADDAAEAILNYLSEACSDYDYILSLRLNVNTIESRAATTKAFECLLKSEDFVANVIHEFDANSRLGMLFPSPAYTRNDTSCLCREWLEHKPDIMATAAHLNLLVDESMEIPAPYAGMYWCNAKAMQTMLDIKAGLPEKLGKKSSTAHTCYLDSILSLLAQKAGYYSEWLFSDEFAAIEITNLYFFLNKLIQSAAANNQSTIWQIANKIKQ